MKKKKILALLLTATLALQSSAALATNPVKPKTSVADSNTAQTAETISLNQRKAYVFKDYDTENDWIYDQTHYYKFVPSTTDFYTVSVDSFIADETYINIYTVSGSYVGSGSWDQFTNTCRATAKLTAGATYYIEINLNVEDGTHTAYTSISKHVHRYETTLDRSKVESGDWNNGVVTWAGSITKFCEACGTDTYTEIPNINKITLSKTSYTYDGKIKKPTVTIKDRLGKTVSASNYTVSYASGRKNVGKYKVTITFKGNYSGKTWLYFTINPKGTSLTSITPKSRGFTAKFKKQTNQTTGYQLAISTDSKFKTAGVSNCSSNKKSSVTISNLKPKKKYYVRIRTYKTVGGKKYYSAWSAAKTVTTKK